MKTIIVKPQSVEKKWYLIDAEGKELGRVAVAAANILRGKNKPEYLPNEDMGDYVIIINAAKAALSGNKANDKMYYRVSGYAGGLSRRPMLRQSCASRPSRWSTPSRVCFPRDRSDASSSPV